jgi:phage tail-like protein
VRPQGAKFWRVGGRAGWSGRTADWSGWTADFDLAVSDAHGLRLAADPHGPLSLGAADGSAGGLVLPRGMAFDDENTLYLLVTAGPDAPSIKRFDPESRTFTRLREVGGAGSEVRRFADPQNIAIAGKRLYVADTGNRRIQVFDLVSLALVEIFDARGDRADWNPVDVSEHHGNVYILDANRARVYRRTQTGHLVAQFEVREKAGQWSRILLASDGIVYLLNLTQPDRPVLETAHQGAPIADAGAVRDLFENPALRLDERGRFCLPEPLTRSCGRRKPASPPSPDVPLGLCPPFDRRAQRCREKPNAPRTTRTAEGSWLLFVVEREQLRVDAYTAGGRRLRHSWGMGMDWQPCDVAARGPRAFVLDEKNQAVYRHQAGYDALRLFVQSEPDQTFWSRVAVDEAGMIYLYAPGQTNVQAFDCAGSACHERPYREVAQYFEVPAPTAPPLTGTGLYFDRNGTSISVDPSEPSGIALYRTTGSWQSEPFDSLQYRCQWHRIEIGIGSFPPSSKIDIFTCAHQNAVDVLTVPDSAWQHAHTIVAPVQSPPRDTERNKTFDFLVQSGVGQFLSVRIGVASDGFRTPAVETMKVHYPRDSYLQYLPATYAVDDESRIFLERFLSIFQTEWDKLDRQIDEEERYFDPDAVPAGPSLDYLAAQWLGLTLEGTWTEAQKRRLLSAAPKIFLRRGQVGGLRDFIAVYLANLTGMETADVQRAGFPIILESFRERQYLIVSDDDASRLGHGAPLWSSNVERRLQLGVFAQEGEAALVSTGDPEHDVFDRFAHRFRVNIPADWVRTASDERMLRRAIDNEKPAHTNYDLCLMGARFRVGTQSTVGIDTIIGDIPRTLLACGSCQDLPPSRPPEARLGYDTVLSAPANCSGLQCTTGTRFGSFSVLA